MKIVVRTFAIILLLAVGVLAFVYIAPGYDIYFVRSESMKPTLNLGDMIITGPIGSPFNREIVPGTIITFKGDKGPVTHRALSISENSIITKGDANEDPDVNPVPVSSVIGAYIFKVPYVGYLITFTRTRMGWFLAILIPTAILLGFVVKDILKEAFATEETKTLGKKREKVKTIKTSKKIATKVERSPVRSESDERIREILISALNGTYETSSERNVGGRHM